MMSVSLFISDERAFWARLTVKSGRCKLYFCQSKDLWQQSLLNLSI